MDLTNTMVWYPAKVVLLPLPMWDTSIMEQVCIYLQQRSEGTNLELIFEAQCTPRLFNYGIMLLDALLINI